MRIADRTISIRWLVAAAGITLLLAPLLLVRVPGKGAWLDAARDGSHAPIFAGVAVLIALLLPAGGDEARPAAWPDWSRCGRALALSVLLGVLIEFLQSFQGRPPSLPDVRTDTAGAVAGLAVWALVRRRCSGAAESGPRRGLGLVLGLLLIAVATVAWRPVETALAYVHRANNFPVIVDFQRPMHLHFVNTDAVPIWIESLPAGLARHPAEHALAVPYDPAQGGVLRLSEPIPDWQGHGVLAVDAANPASEDVELDLLIWDSDRYWSRGAPDAQTIRLPAGARATFRIRFADFRPAAGDPPLDRSSIEHVVLRVAGPVARGKLYVARVWLE